MTDKRPDLDLQDLPELIASTDLQAIQPNQPLYVHAGTADNTYLTAYIGDVEHALARLYTQIDQARFSYQALGTQLLNFYNKHCRSAAVYADLKLWLHPDHAGSTIVIPFAGISRQAQALTASYEYHPLPTHSKTGRMIVRLARAATQKPRVIDNPFYEPAVSDEPPTQISDKTILYKSFNDGRLGGTR